MLWHQLDANVPLLKCEEPYKGRHLTGIVELSGKMLHVSQLVGSRAPGGELGGVPAETELADQFN